MKVFEFLAKNTGLFSLLLSHNKVSVKGAQALALNKTLKQLDLNYNMIQTEGAIALAQNTTLTSLMLAGNGIASLGVSAFADNPSLTELNMSYNHVDDTGAAALAKLPALTHLNLGYNQITFDGALTLSQMTRLVSLIICHNLLKDPGVAALAQIKTLRHLDVAGNRVAVEGAHALALNTYLWSLVLSSNLVGDVGAVLLARNNHLTRLFLSYNNIGDAGAAALAGNKRLKVLNLNYNEIGEKGRQVLLQNKTCTSLILSKEQPPKFTEENLSTIFSLSESFLCITDAKGIIQFFNPTFPRILGYTDDELLTQSFFSFFHAENKPLLETKLSKFEKPVPQNFESRYQCRDGAFRTIRWAAHPKHDRLYIMGTDITEQRYIEKEFLSAQQGSILSRLQESEMFRVRQTDFIAQLSHEVRNPLSGLYGLTEALKIQLNELEQLIHTLCSLSSLFEQEKINQTFVEIRDTCTDMLGCMEYQKAILNDNLDVVRITEKRLTLEKHVFELKTALREVVKILQAKAIQKGVELRAELPDQKEVWVKSDSLRFKQIIINLIGNAVKFTESGGKVDLIFTLPAAPADRVGVKIAVVDTGIGMTEEELKHLFQRFSQTTLSTGKNYEGSGLGLYLAKQMALLMQGDITVTSRQGQGSTFSFDVQFESVSDQEKISFQQAKLLPLFPTTKTINKSTVKKRTALIVDDNLINLKVLERLLTPEGYDCQTAKDGIEALVAYDHSPVDIILMDIVMPNMDGLTATQEIRRRELERGLPRTPIIAITANAQERDREREIAAGMDDYSVKPFEKAEICRKIDTLLHGKVATESKSVGLHPLSIPRWHDEPPASTSISGNSTTSFSSSSSLIPVKEKRKKPIILSRSPKKKKNEKEKEKETKRIQLPLETLTTLHEREENIHTAGKPLSPSLSGYALHAQFLPPPPRNQKVRALLEPEKKALDAGEPDLYSSSGSSSSSSSSSAIPSSLSTSFSKFMSQPRRVPTDQKQQKIENLSLIERARSLVLEKYPPAQTETAPFRADFLQKLAGIQQETESLSNLTVNKMLLEGLISGLEKLQTSLVLF